MFILLLVTNWVLNLKLASQRILLNQMADRLDEYSIVKKQAIDIDKKTAFYTGALSRRAILGDKAEVIFSNLGESIILRSATITNERFGLDFVVTSPLDFAKLVDRYLQTGVVSHVTLKSADFITGTGTYLVVIEGGY